MLARELNFGNNRSWGAGGPIEFDLGASAANSDLIDVSGDLLKPGSGTYSFAFLNNGWVNGMTYDLITFHSTTFNLTDFSYNNEGGFGGNFGFSGGNTLQFTLNAAPEPSLALMSAAVVGAVCLRRRRRQS